MRIGIDVDGVLSPTYEPFIRWYNQQYGTNFVISQFIDDRLETVLGHSTKEMIRILYLFYDSRDFQTIEPSLDTREVIPRLRKEHELVIVTARPDDLQEHTRTWAQRYFPGCFTKIVHANHYALNGNGGKDKPALYQKVGSNIIIEDLHGLAGECVDRGMGAFLFDEPWNRRPLKKGMQRVHSWREIGDLVACMI